MEKIAACEAVTKSGTTAGIDTNHGTYSCFGRGIGSAGSWMSFTN
jgi:hypothetical protein